jgi:hypothetical protein
MPQHSLPFSLYEARKGLVKQARSVLKSFVALDGEIAKLEGREIKAVHGYGYMVIHTDSSGGSVIVCSDDDDDDQEEEKTDVGG